MTPRMYTQGEVEALLKTVVAGIRVGGVEDVVYSLAEVAARTGFCKRQLAEDCRAGLIPHTRRGKAVGMTSSQIADLITKHRDDRSDRASATREADELASAREATRRGAAGRAPRRAA